MQELLEERERLGVVEDDGRDPAPVGNAVVAEDALAEALGECRLHFGIVAQEVVHDLVARDGRRAVRAKRRQHAALPRRDPSRDRDRDAGATTR